LVDATPRGGAPGTLYVIEIDAEHLDEIDANGPSLDGHGMDPMRVLALVKSMGGKPTRLLIVGCEPAPVAEQEDSGLSKPVAAMLEKAVELVESLVRTTINEEMLNTDRTVVRC
jgi:hydrogenase maturation protease